MKILFLDIDGVCNCQFTPNRFGIYIGIDPPMAARVRRIIKETGCKVVLSSTWRLDKEFRDEVADKVCKFIDVTPSGGVNRGVEVQQWLDEHPEVTHYAILDDNEWFNEGQNLFLTSFSVGLTDEVADNVIEHLGREKSHAATDRVR